MLVALSGRGFRLDGLAVLEELLSTAGATRHPRGVAGTGVVGGSADLWARFNSGDAVRLPQTCMLGLLPILGSRP